MGQAVSNIFTATVVDVAKNAWSSVVQTMCTFASWLGREVQSLVASVVNGINTIVQKMKTFFITLRHNIEEFTARIFPATTNVKGTIWTNVYEVGDGMRNAGIKHMRDRLKELSIVNDVDSLSDDQVVATWNEYMKNHPLNPEEQKELDSIMDLDKNTVMMSGTGGYSKLRSDPLSAKDQKEMDEILGGGVVPGKRMITSTISQESVEYICMKDHVITHVTLILLSSEHFKKGQGKPPPLTPDEEVELNLILSF